MPRYMMTDEDSKEIATSKESPTNQARALTHDERKAAEAAFRGEPFNPAWSVAAAKVYAGIVTAKLDADAVAESDINAEYSVTM